MSCSFMTIAAERYIPNREDRCHFESEEEVELCVQLAIDRAREMIAPDGEGQDVINVVVTACGSLMAMVRWNLDLDTSGTPDEWPIEVARFARPLILC